jgi:hypothetical protein
MLLYGYVLHGQAMFDPVSGSYFNLYFHSRPKPIDDQHQTIDGEPSQISVADTGEVCGRNSGAALCAANT